MKFVQEFVGFLALLIIVIVAAQSRLPDAPNSRNVAMNAEATVGDAILFEGAALFGDWQVNDYLLIRTATSSRLGLTFVADPITGKWYRVPQA